MTSVFFLAVTALDAHAQSIPIRRTRLQDGREFVAEVVGTEATGLRVRVPAGEMLVSFEDLLEVKPIDAAAYAAQPAWPVLLVAPESLLPAAEGMFNAMPGVLARPATRADAAFTAAQTEAMASCGADVTCLRTVVKANPWQWVVALEPQGAGGVKVTSLVSTAERALPATVAVDAVEPVALWSALHRAIGLQAPTSAPPAVPGLDAKGGKPAKPVKPEGPAVAAGASGRFVPIPGWTSFRAGDGGNGAIAVAGTVGFTTLSAVAGALLVSDEPPPALVGGQAAVFGALGYLSSAWLFNHLGAERAVAWAPTPNGAVVEARF